MMVPDCWDPSSDTALVEKFAYTFWPTDTVGVMPRIRFNEKTKYVPVTDSAVARLDWAFTAVTEQHGPVDAGAEPVSAEVAACAATAVLRMAQQEVLPSSETCLAVKFA